jgi:hypothetical protein
MLFTITLCLLVLWLVIQLWDFIVSVLLGALVFVLGAGFCVAVVGAVWFVAGR